MTSQISQRREKFCWQQLGCSFFTPLIGEKSFKSPGEIKDLLGEVLNTEVDEMNRWLDGNWWKLVRGETEARLEKRRTNRGLGRFTKMER